MSHKYLFVNLESVFSDVKYAYAHIDGKEKPVEFLGEHTHLVEYYFVQLWEQLSIYPIVASFLDDFIQEEEVRNFFFESLYNLVTFHDVGKINVKFQNKLYNTSYKRNVKSVLRTNDSAHSFLSSVLYLDYFGKQLETKSFSKEQKSCMMMFLWLFSWVIDRHHSDLGQMQKFAAKFLVQDNPEFEDFMEEVGMWQTAQEQRTYDVCQLVRTGYGYWKQHVGTVSLSIRLQGILRLLLSLLVTADFYATSEYMSGFQMKSYGSILNINEIQNCYKTTNLIKQVRTYERTMYPKKQLKNVSDINVLRNEMFLDAERQLKQHEERLLMLECPTGAGKTNISLNLSLQLIQKYSTLRKIHFISPFNALVEQERASLESVFGKEKQVSRQIAVVNSITPLKNITDMDYQKIWLDRQFLNYPMVLTTHVSFFQTMFGEQRSDVFGFHQLVHSVVILDEIQSYDISLWGELIQFLQEYADLLDIRVVIMSATLPDLRCFLDEDANKIVNLITQPSRYFEHPLFANRVMLDRNFLSRRMDIETLGNHVLCSAKTNKKILIEFLTKKSAEAFYKWMQQHRLDDIESLYFMSGDTDLYSRGKIIESIKKNHTKSVILIATQVIEAGVDVDMDIGYKNISKLDSEEQFLGRINRSCKRTGLVYFFFMDDASVIYKEEIRTHTQYILSQDDMYEILRKKQFEKYYHKIVSGNENLLYAKQARSRFFSGDVVSMNFDKIEEHMRLIKHQAVKVKVFLAYVTCVDGKEVNGALLWQQYKQLLIAPMDFSEKKVRLHDLMCQMQMFMYEVSKVREKPDDQIGDIYYFSDGLKYLQKQDVGVVLDRTYFL